MILGSSWWFDIPNWRDSLSTQKEMVISFLSMNKITTWFLRINSHADGIFIMTNLYEFVHKKFVFVCKTSNLYVQICEGFKNVRLQWPELYNASVYICLEYFF